MSAQVSLPTEPAKPRVHLDVLSNSAIACYRRCAREFRFRYTMLRRPRRSSEALRFGSFFHVGLNAWWACSSSEREDRLTAALEAMRERAEKRPEDSDPFELVKAEELMLGYTARWGSEVYETLAVEKQFSVPLVNPETGAASRTYRVEGAIDVLARDSAGRIVQIEHKTSSDDISFGTDYWRMVSALDPQVSTYQSALKALGHEGVTTLYDVVHKVAMKPLLATTEEKREYTVEKSRQCPFCKKKGNVPGPHRVSPEGEPETFCVDGKIITDPGGRLYKSQRDHDETPEEFRERVRSDITETPEKYFARGPVVRLEDDEREHAADTWQTAKMIQLSENSGSFPRNPGSCRRFHRLCDYFEVCSGNASINDDVRFRTAERAHEELKEV